MIFLAKIFCTFDIIYYLCGIIIQESLIVKMNEDQILHNTEVQGRQEHLYLSNENPIYTQSSGLGMETYRQSQAQAAALQSLAVCPVCGSSLPEGADYCENCRKYVKNDVCSFCGAPFPGDGAYCPECGSPRGGIVCPECHTLNEFAFCKKCGFPLTAEAREQMSYLHQTPEYRHLQSLTTELSRLDNVVPYVSEADQERSRANEILRTRVLRMLAEDKGEKIEEISPRKEERMTESQLETKKMDLARMITEALGEMSTKPQPSPVKARNYAMAMKPSGVRLVWVCNYKHAMHSGPCGCAKPHLGGRWVILGHTPTGNNTTTKD